jgi:DNA-binding IclR family transcriptional regulator
VDEVLPRIESTLVPASKTLDNGLRVLEALAAHPAGMTMGALSCQMGLHRTICYRLVRTLAARRLVVQDDRAIISLGTGLLELAAASYPDLRTAAASQLRSLAAVTCATAHLTIMDGQWAVSLAVEEPTNSDIHVSYRVGYRHALARGAAGLAILSGRPAEAGERSEVTRARRVGYVVTIGELESGAWGLAAPILQPSGRQAVAAVGVVSLSVLEAKKIGAAVVDVAARIAALVRQ